MAFLAADGNLPFTVALVVMFAIAVIEGAATLLGAGLSGLVDTLLPGDADVGAPDLDHGGALSRVLGWLHVGRVPALMWLVIFLTVFGLVGLGLQSAAQKVLGALLPASVAWLPALLLALPVVRLAGGAVARITPGDETDAVTEESFIGRVAVITLGQARAGSPAQARLRDRHGQTHYVMVEPEGEGLVFTSGMDVLLVRRAGAVFQAIPYPNPLLAEPGLR